MPRPSLSTYHPSLGERLQSGFANLLGKVGVDPRYAQHVSERTLGFLNDLTPVGNATMAADAGTAIRNGHPFKGLGLGALAVLPGAAGKIVKRGGMFAAKPIRAWHGSPHDFDKFSLRKIGTGEGAQSYGHGLYFAENPEVAREYQRQLSENGAGHLYEVNINAKPEDFLDWDAPLSQRFVQERFSDVPEVMATDRFFRRLGDAPKGANIYSKLAGMTDRSQAARATDILMGAGLPGIRYLDQGSRGVGNGSRNYVVFDDRLVDILNKY